MVCFCNAEDAGVGFGDVPEPNENVSGQDI